MDGIPGRFDGDFDQTVRHLTAIFEDFTETRDVWQSARHRLATVRRDADPDWAAVRLEASGAELKGMGDQRVTRVTVASAAIVAALRDFAAERLAGYLGHA